MEAANLRENISATRTCWGRPLGNSFQGLDPEYNGSSPWKLLPSGRPQQVLVALMFSRRFAASIFRSRLSNVMKPERTLIFLDFLFQGEQIPATVRNTR